MKNFLRYSILFFYHFQSISAPSNPKNLLIKEEPVPQFHYSQSSHHVHAGLSESSNIVNEQEGTHLSHPRDISRWMPVNSDFLGHASTSKMLIRPRHEFEGNDPIYQEPSKKERLFPNVCTCLYQEDQPHKTPPSSALSIFPQLQGEKHEFQK
ncbi:hypothetical protein PGTUg99_024241 [Puccinia graminis f. sp. tritici]|uniref:Uncharacterized protein n=1 Tax=Puccinia graminis f. sp. tritici TaxID=56615 RepID=A0A5B0LRV1_PUCGR|nr:hypothetical protein PGTUg99_024241 [Puccinia graminis f. sp. tritici]